MSTTNENPVTSPYWNGWITFAFGLAIIASYLVVGVFLGVVIGLFLLILNPGSGQSDITSYLTNNEGLIVAISSYATTVIGIGLIVIFIKVKNRLSIFEYLGLRSVNLKTILLMVFITVGLLIISALVGKIVDVPSSGFDEQIYRTSGWPPLLWLALVVCAPLFEETFFRGFLFEGFRRSKLGISGTIIITSLAWASLHVQYGLYEIASIFVLGTILGLVRYRTGSLWAPMLIHAGWNLAVTIQLALTVT